MSRRRSFAMDEPIHDPLAPDPLEPGCSQCSATSGQQCYTATGAPCQPHVARLKAAKAMAAKRAERAAELGLTPPSASPSVGRECVDRCRVCGCSPDKPCEDSLGLGCGTDSESPDLCSLCRDLEDELLGMLGALRTPHANIIADVLNMADDPIVDEPRVLSAIADLKKRGELVGDEIRGYARAKLPSRHRDHRDDDRGEPTSAAEQGGYVGLEASAACDHCGRALVGRAFAVRVGEDQKLFCFVEHAEAWERAPASSGTSAATSAATSASASAASAGGASPIQAKRDVCIECKSPKKWGICGKCNVPLCGAASCRERHGESALHQSKITDADRGDPEAVAEREERDRALGREAINVAARRLRGWLKSGVLRESDMRAALAEFGERALTAAINRVESEGRDQNKRARPMLWQITTGDEAARERAAAAAAEGQLGDVGGATVASGSSGTGERAAEEHEARGEAAEAERGVDTLEADLVAAAEQPVTEEEALQVGCSTCEADAGERCKKRSGWPCAPHVARINGILIRRRYQAMRRAMDETTGAEAEREEGLGRDRAAAEGQLGDVGGATVASGSSGTGERVAEEHEALGEAERAPASSGTSAATSASASATSAGGASPIQGLGGLAFGMLADELIDQYAPREGVLALQEFRKRAAELNPDVLRAGFELVGHHRGKPSRRREARRIAARLGAFGHEVANDRALVVDAWRDLVLALEAALGAMRPPRRRRPRRPRAEDAPPRPPSRAKVLKRELSLYRSELAWLEAS